MVDKEKSISFYIKWLFIFVLLMASIIIAGIYVAKRDEQRMAERKYEFNIIQSIIENLAVYQDEIESWGYQVSVLTPEEEPEDDALHHYYVNHCQPVLILSDADGGRYFFYYGFDQYTTETSYPSMMNLLFGASEPVEVLKSVKLRLTKNHIYQAPYLENTSEIGTEPYYDMEVEIYVEGVSPNTSDAVDAYGTGYYRTNYCSNNFVDGMYFTEIDSSTKHIRADYRIKQEYSAEQLLSFYQKGLELQERLIELYQGTCLLTSP